MSFCNYICLRRCEERPVEYSRVNGICEASKVLSLLFTAIEERVYTTTPVSNTGRVLMVGEY
jgi:hypothetical protein